MSKIAIKGHDKKGEEVIEILEILGGKNVYDLSGDTSCSYYVIEKGEIRCGDYIYGNEPYTILTLEEFLEKYPYKVWDKVICDEEFVGKIVGMSWDEDVDEIYYSIIYHDEIFKYPVDLLQPHKEKPKELLIGFTKDSDDNWVLNTHKDYEIKEVGGTFKLIRKQPKYPKTYAECCEVLVGRKHNQYEISFDKMELCLVDLDNTQSIDFQTPQLFYLDGLFRLLMCRNAYWKIAGEQMGLGEPWKQDYDDRCFIIANNNGNIYTYEYHGSNNVILTFPTKEMRDAFYENFKDLIEVCKEFL